MNPLMKKVNWFFKRAGSCLTGWLPAGLWLCSLMMTPACSLQAMVKNQTGVFTFADFEDGSLQGFSGGSVVANPQTGPENPGQYALFYGGAAWWGPGKWLENGHHHPDIQSLHIDVFLPAGATQNQAVLFILHLRNCPQTEIDHWQSAPISVSADAQWVSLEFDLSGLQHYCHRNLVLASSSQQGFYSDNYRFIRLVDDYPEDLLFAENFEGVIFPPQGWSLAATQHDNPQWSRSLEQNHSLHGHFSGFHEAAGFSNAENWLISPPISLPDTGTWELSFWSLVEQGMWYNPGSGSNVNSVWISTTGSNPHAGDFEKIWEAAQVQNYWEAIDISLQGYNAAEIYLAFVYKGSAPAHQWFIDDVSVRAGEPWFLLSSQPVEACASSYISLEVSLDNPVPSTAFQFDMALPEGFQYIEGSASLHRMQDHLLQSRSFGDSLLRIIAYSPQNLAFTDNQELLLSLQLHAAPEAGQYMIHLPAALVTDTTGRNRLHTGLAIPVWLSPSTTLIHTHPQSQQVFMGEDVHFFVEAEGQALEYQWYFNHQAIQGGQSADLWLQSVSLNQAGAYHCVVIGQCGVLISQSASLTVVDDTPMYPVRFTVSDQDAQPVPMAEINISQQAPLFTDEQGQAETQLPQGMYPYTVIAPGHLPHSGLFFVTNQEVLVSVSLLPTAISEHLFKQLRVYPLPFTSGLHLENIAWAEDLQIIDLTGRILHAQSLDHSQSVRLELGHLLPGMYVLQLSNKKGDVIRKNIIK